MFRLDFAAAVMLYLVNFLQIKMVGMLKSRAIACVKPGFLCQMLIFHQITKFYGGKCACIQTLDMKWIEMASKYCTLTLSLEGKRSNIQCKI